MYAVIRTNGFQYTVEKGSRIVVPALLGKSGDEITMTDVLMCSNEGKVAIGRPILSDVKVEGRITKTGKLDKVVIYKFIRREKYRRKKGHRQNYTEVEITDIKQG
jgi:large subunit ribosomal protein L21